VILIDANILLYAYQPRAPQHDACRRWIEATFSADEPVGLSWITVLAFLRISTNPRIFEAPLLADEAIAIVSSWLERASVSVVEAGPHCWEILRQSMVDAQIAGPLVMDAFLAALALENGATLATTDRDFARFSTLRLVDPTAA
jgi:toxin-antitoxin system PIN domain toxin